MLSMPDTRPLVRIAAGLFVVYFIALGLIDWLTGGRDEYVVLYYTVQTSTGLVLLALTLLPWSRMRVEAALVPAAIVLIAVLPTVIVHVLLRLAPSAPLRSAEGMTFRLTPVLLIGLLLTVWHFNWRHMVAFCLVTAALNLSGIALLPVLWRGPRDVPTQPLIITGIQTVSYLMIGAITWMLVDRLRSQQRALVDANIALQNQAATQIELSIIQERNRIARELHDTLAHTLSAQIVELQTVKAYWDIDPKKAQLMLDNALTASRDGLKETRLSLKALRATPLEELGLADSLRQLVNRARAQTKMALHLAIPVSLPPLDPNVAHCVYRISQEAIMNAIHHADGNNLAVTLATQPGSKAGRFVVELTIHDDGIGFNPAQDFSSHWGIKGLHERAALVGGRLSIESDRSTGTTVHFVVPEAA